MVTAIRLILECTLGSALDLRREQAGEEGGGEATLKSSQFCVSRVLFWISVESGLRYPDFADGFPCPPASEKCYAERIQS